MQTGITVHRTINQIISLAQSGRHSEALPLAKKLSRKHPDDAQVWLVLAGLHAASGNMDSVIDCCERSIKLNPCHAGAHYNLATALHHAGRHNEALAAYRKCLELDTNSMAAMTGIADPFQPSLRLALLRLARDGRYALAPIRFEDGSVFFVFVRAERP